jgi:hypothetical protein
MKMQKIIQINMEFAYTVVEKGQSFINAQGELKLYGALQYLEMSLSHKRQLGEKTIGTQED